DDGLSQIKAGQERKGYPVTGTTFGALDYPKLAAAFGIAGIDVTTVEECRAAFRSPPADRPRLVAAHVDPRAYRFASPKATWQFVQLFGSQPFRRATQTGHV